MKPVFDLIERILPGRSGEFLCETIPKENGMDVWELGGRDGKIVLRGNNAGSASAAFGWYVKYTLKCSLTWCGKRMVLPEGALPMPEPYRRVIRQKYRVYMNYCTHSYSAAWWSWDRWEFEIDMMALSGINMPLAITGTEAVWYETLLELGFTDGEARDFLAGPAFLAWQWMTNLEHHGGPLPLSWIREHEALGKRILERELSFGMHPIQQGYSGFVPNRMKEKYPEGKFLLKKTWNNIGRTTELDPLDPLFRRVGMAFLRNQEKLFGVHGFYACDPFHEGVPPVEGAEYLHKVAEAISGLYAAFDKDYTWVMQAWSIRQDIACSVPKEHLLVLDINSSFPLRHEGFWGYPCVTGVLHNFGARMSSLHGDVPKLAGNRYLLAQDSASACVGAGLFMEGIGQNPVFYDLGLEMLTRSDSVDPSQWLRGYVERRYGSLQEDALRAWELLLQYVYIPDTDFTERGTVLCTRPCLRLRGTGPCDSFHVHYPNEKLLEAVKLLKKANCGTEGWKYDLMDFTRQLLSNYAQKAYGEVVAAWDAKDLSAFDRTTEAYLTLMGEIDKMLSARPEWTLGKWIADARAHGTTPEEKDQYEYNARMQVTVWGNEDASLLFDYAWKEWSGLIGTYHAVRYEKFFAMLREKLRKGEDYDEDALTVFENRIVWHASDFYKELGDWEAGWLHSTEPMPEMSADADYAAALVEKYADRI